MKKIKGFIDNLPIGPTNRCFNLKERFTAHDIRAKTLTDAAGLGQDAQKLAGHKSRAMTDRYIKTRTIEKVKPLSRNIRH